MKRVIVALAFTTLMCAGVVRADTITIADGTVEMDFQSGVRTAVLLGANTDIVAFGNNSNSIAFNAGQIDAFSPSVNISTGGSSPTSAERIGGVLFPAGDRLQGSLVLTTSPFTADVQSGSMAFFQTPFSMTGTVSMFDPAGTLLGRTSLNGAGEASILARTIPGVITGYNTQHISYQFGAAAQAAATPEPASIALLGLGLGGGLLGKRALKKQ